MVLRNAFADMATEDTLEEIRLRQITRQEKLLEQILVQLKILNLHMATVNQEEYTEEDLDLEHNK